MNLERIAQVAAQECIRQEVGILELGSLLFAYDSAYVRHKANPKNLTPDDILLIGETLNVGTWGLGFRETPVTFQNGGSSADWFDIPRLMDNLCELLPHVETEEDINGWIKQLLWVHPFRDGNGRTGWILYNLLMGTMDSPSNLPKFFGE